MKKIAKLSLVAAVAVAGLTSANAGSLENAIKNTDISGQFRYRMHNSEQGATSTTDTDVEIEVGVKSKVTDNVTAVFKIDNAPNNSDTKVDSDKLDVEDYYFSYTGNGVTANLGQQNIPTRQLDGKQGDGLVLLTKVAGFTVGGAYFVNNNASGGTIDSKDVTSALVTGNVGPAKILAQFSAVQDTLDAINVMASAKVGPVSISAEHASVDQDGDSKELETNKLIISGKVANIGLTAGYAGTGKDGSGTIGNEIVGNATSGVEAPAELIGFQLHSAGRNDFSAMLVKIDVPVAAKTTATIYHATGEEGTTDASETFGQVTYKSSKNLTTYFRYGVLEVEGAKDKNKARLEVKYSF